MGCDERPVFACVNSKLTVIRLFQLACGGGIACSKLWVPLASSEELADGCNVSQNI